MKILMFDRVPEAVAWARERMNLTGAVGDVTAVSLVDDKGEFMAVTVYSAYTGVNMDMHIAARPKCNWLSRNYFNASFYLPFKVLEVPRITGLIRGANLDAQRFVSRLGFQYEGRMRKAFEDGEDLVLYGFLLEEYQKHPWSKYEIDKRVVVFGSGTPAGEGGPAEGSGGEAGGAAPLASSVA